VENIQSAYFCETYDVAVKKSGKYNCASESNSGALITNILATKSEKGPLPYCKTRTKLEGFNGLSSTKTKSVTKSYYYYSSHQNVPKF
jgi:hypothetical protein